MTLAAFDFEVELAEFEGYPIKCIVHDIVDGKLDIEIEYSSDLEEDATRIKSLISDMIVSTLENSNNKPALNTYSENPFTA